MEDEERKDIMQFYIDNPIDSLFKLRQIFHKWFAYTDETLLDLCLGVRIHTEWLGNLPLTPLWFFIVAPSGDRKSETIRAFESSGKVYLMNHITKNTLASGWKARKKNDLAPKLDRKCVLTYDFGQFLKIQSKEKAQIWSQFRSAFDGYVIRHTGSGVETAYKDLCWNWLVGSTPLIDDELIMGNQLGTRELMYRMSSDEKISVEVVQEKVWNNTNVRELMRLELYLSINSFLDSWKSKKIKYKDIEISDKAKRRIMMYARFIAYLRANASSDNQTGQLTTFVEPEKPTRNLEQLKGLFIALKSLSSCYTDKLALKRLEKIAKSSINPIRLRILRELATKRGLSNERVPLSIAFLRKRLGLGYKTILRELMTLFQLGFVDYIGNSNRQGGREWYISALEEEKSQIIDFILENETIERIEENDKEKEITSNNKEQLIYILDKILSLNFPMTLTEIQKQSVGVIPTNKVYELLQQLISENKIYQPDSYKYQRVS